jgi:tetratricopeptide (TPR) repeat protein
MIWIPDGEKSETRIDNETAGRLYDLAMAHHRNGDSAKGLEILDALISSNPKMAFLHLQRGSIQYAMKQFETALSSFGAAIALDSACAEAHFGIGAVAQAQGNLNEAFSAYNRALEIDPKHAPAFNNRGLVLRELGDISAALQSYDAAIDLLPDCPDFRFGKAMCLLLQGRYREGWPLYEWRKANIQPVAPAPQNTSPWRGEALAGKVLLIQAEQGLGDTIQFCRFGCLARAQGAQVVLQVQDRLARLMETLPSSITVIGETSPAPACDYHEMLLSMPFRFEGAIPDSVPYLSADPARLRYWRERIGREGFKIGISWQGEKMWEGREKPEDAARSFPVSLFRGICGIPGVRLVSLQKNHGVEQLDNLPDGMTIETLGDGLDAGPHSFLDTAAVMEGLDLVISADTAIAHLAGALGRPNWLALKCTPDWRWLLGRDDSPWYPSMRIFRQTAPGDWAGLFGRMEASLRSELARIRSKP